MSEQPETSAWLSVASTASMLGVSPLTIYRMFNDGDLPGFRARTAIRIPDGFVADALAAIRASGQGIDLAEFGRQWAMKASTA